MPTEPVLQTPETEIRKAQQEVELEQKRVALATMQTRLHELEALEKKLKEATTSARNQLAAWQSKRKEHEQAVHQLENHIRFLNDQSTAIDPKNPSVLNLLGSLSEVTKSIQLPGLRDKLAKERKLLEASEKNIATLKKQLSELKNQRSGIRKAMDELEVETERLKREIGALMD